MPSSSWFCTRPAEKAMNPMQTVSARVDTLVSLFTRIAETRMSGVPILNPSLRVEAVGMETCKAADSDDTPGVVGILITPWFMNLVWLPLARTDRPAMSGTTRSRALECGSFDFICAHEPEFGDYEACSLFSPMFDFADHPTAHDTAKSVLRKLREPALPREAALNSVAVATPAQARASELPARRAFLFGRSSRASA